MGSNRQIARWLGDVIDGDPVAVGFAVPVGLALVGLIVLTIRHARATRTPPPAAKKKLRWPEDGGPPATQGEPSGTGSQ
jgi:hypothetical protein